MNNGYFQHPCRKRLITRPQDVDSGDFSLRVTAQESSQIGLFDITVILTPKVYFGDVQAVLQSQSAALFDQADAENPAALIALPVEGTEDGLTLNFEGIEPSTSNVANQWKIQITNLSLLAKDGQNITLPIFHKTFPSPL